MSLNMFHLSIELFGGFLALMLLTKLLGKTQMNQVTPFEFISSLVLGELVGNAIYDNDIHLWYILYAVIFWAILIYCNEKIAQKFNKSRIFLEGNPSILVRNGQIDFNMLKKENININELQSMLRLKDAFSVREVEYAILEPSGSLSVLKKSKYDNPTNEDLNLIEKPIYLPVAFILDGEILFDNLKNSGFNEVWLKKQLHSNGFGNVKDIFFAEWKEDEGIHIVPLRK